MTEYAVTEYADSAGGYGISALKDKTPVKSISGIFTKKADAQAVADLLNGLEVELCHMEDIIEDYLTDFSV